MKENKSYCKSCKAGVIPMGGAILHDSFCPTQSKEPRYTISKEEVHTGTEPNITTLSNIMREEPKKICKFHDSTETCPVCRKEPKEKLSWEEDFDNKFTLEWWYGFSAQTPAINKMGITGIKSFIKSALSSQRAFYENCPQCEGLKDEVLAQKIKQVEEKFREFEIIGVEVELSDVLKILKEDNEN